MILLYKVISLDYNLLWRARHLHPSSIILELLMLRESLHLHDGWRVCHSQSRTMLLPVGAHGCVGVAVAKDQLSELKRKG